MHRVRVEIHGKNVTIEFDGFYGEECYREAERLYELLKAKGLNVVIKRTVPKLDSETAVTSSSTATAKERWW